MPETPTNPGRGALASEPSDSSLLARFRRGSQDAATLLYLRYAERLRALTRAQCSPGIARCVDVEDLVQSVFATFFQGVSAGQYDVPDGEELWKLFLVLALNRIRAHAVFHHAAKRDVRLLAGSSAALVTYAGQDDSAFTFLQLVVREELERLSGEQRRAVELRIEGYHVGEIARQTGRSRRSVERLLQEARKKLGVLLDEHCNAGQAAGEPPAGGP